MVRWRLMELQLGTSWLEPCVWRTHVLVLLVMLNWRGSAITEIPSWLCSNDADDHLETAGTDLCRLV